MNFLIIKRMSLASWKWLNNANKTLQDGVWVSSSEYASAEPDPLRDCAERIVDEINANNREDLHRFCNIYADLNFQVNPIIS